MQFEFEKPFVHPYTGEFVLKWDWYKDFVPEEHVHQTGIPGLLEIAYMYVPFSRYETDGLGVNVIGPRSPFVTVVFQGIGEEGRDRADLNYSSIGGLAAHRILSADQLWIVDPPANSESNPIKFDDFVDKSREVLTEVSQSPHAMPPRNLRVLANSAGCLVAAEALRRGDLQVGGHPVTDISFITPAGISRAGLEHIQAAGKNWKQSNGLWKVNNHWYSSDFFERLAEVDTVNMLKKAQKKNISVILLPESPHTKGALLLPDELACLKVLGERSNIHVVEPPPDTLHRMGHEQSDIVYAQALDIPSEYLGLPPNLWPVHREKIYYQDDLKFNGGDTCGTALTVCA